MATVEQQWPRARAAPPPPFRAEQRRAERQVVTTQWGEAGKHSLRLGSPVPACLASGSSAPTSLGQACATRDWERWWADFPRAEEHLGSETGPSTCFPWV